MLRVKIGREVTEQKDRSAEGAVADFVEIKTEIDALNEKLKVAKEVLIDKAVLILGDDETSTITFSVDDDSVQISFGYDIKVKDEDTLRKILADRFDDLVTTKTTFTPDKKLKEMALEDDGLHECMSVKAKTPALKVVK